MSLKKWRVLLAIAVLLSLSGCGYSKNQTENKSSSNSENVSDEKNQESNLPKATGKVEDVVSALSEDVSSEQSVTSKEEEVAKNAVADSKEADDFANTSDENSL